VRGPFTNVWSDRAYPVNQLNGSYGLPVNRATVGLIYKPATDARRTYVKLLQDGDFAGLGFVTCQE
jgi:hypothetical protein